MCKLTGTINGNFAHQCIQFLSNNEIHTIRNNSNINFKVRFKNIYNLHGVIGCLDCAHIYIALVVN